MAYDAYTGTVVSFGGLESDNNAFGDTWTWNGIAKGWTKAFPASSPAPRRTMIAYDALDKTV